jgi:hypothetical protein
MGDGTIIKIKDGMGSVCRTHARKVKCIPSFIRKLEGKRPLEDLNVYGKKTPTKISGTHFC